jgi:hypothetical protein
MDSNRGMRFRFAKRRDNQTDENSERGAAHGRLIKGLTGFATFGD